MIMRLCNSNNRDCNIVSNSGDTVLKGQEHKKASPNHRTGFSPEIKKDLTKIVQIPETLGKADLEHNTI